MAAPSPELAGDYRLEGADSNDEDLLVEVEIRHDEHGGWTVARTLTYVDDEHRLLKPVTWVASKVERVGKRRLSAVFGDGAPSAGMDAVLGEAAPAESSGGLHGHVTGTYELSSDGETLTESLSSDEKEKVGGKKGWRWSNASGGHDYPTLRVLREARCSDLLGDGLDRYEASGVAWGGDRLYVAFDNAWQLAEVGPELSPATSRLLKIDGGHGHGNSDFEGVSWDPEKRRLYVLIEADKKHGDLAPGLWQINRDLELSHRSWLPHEPPSRGKGFEGLVHLRRDGEQYLLGLLEGNHGKSDERAIDRGHGRIVVFHRLGSEDYEEVAIIALPPTARFSDYSGLDLSGDRLAVVSQTSSLLWVGTLAPDAWEIQGQGTTYRFPRQGAVALYASVEGVAWLPDGTLAVVSDRYPGKSEVAALKDQSIHIVKLP